MNVPCKGCGRRTVKCHAECEEYRKFQEEVKRMRNTEKKEKANMSLTFMAKYYN